jgi:signal transduction histidine kinase
MFQFLFRLLIALPLTLAIAALVGQAIARRALRPLEEMTARAGCITANNLNDRLVISNPDDELGHMARVLNHLLQRLDEALHQLQRFTADAAHELHTPLASLRAIVEVALEKGDKPEKYREAIGSILEETNRLNETLTAYCCLPVPKRHKLAPKMMYLQFQNWSMKCSYCLRFLLMSAISLLCKKHSVCDRRRSDIYVCLLPLC